jgi:hypothetical protein
LQIALAAATETVIETLNFKLLTQLETLNFKLVTTRFSLAGVAKLADAQDLKS